jgi:hypothetical protein
MDLVDDLKDLVLVLGTASLLAKKALVRKQRTDAGADLKRMAAEGGVPPGSASAKVAPAP